jgi:putative endonuclease
MREAVQTWEGRMSRGPTFFTSSEHPNCKTSLRKSEVKQYFVYIVRTAKNYLYTGISIDPKKRCCEHNEGSRGAKCLLGQRPVTLVWQSIQPRTRSNALKIERKVKLLNHAEKEKLICGEFSFFWRGIDG